MKLKPVLSKFLISSVLITIGFILGKEFSLRNGSQGDAGGALGVPEGNKAIVYYMHTTIRCVTCNQIEKMAQNVVATEFSQAREDGRLVWKDVDFQRNDALANRYDVVSSCVVVVHVRNGKEVSFQRLDEVWTLAEKPKEFDEYIAAAIRSCLEEGKV